MAIIRTDSSPRKCLIQIEKMFIVSNVQKKIG